MDFVPIFEQLSLRICEDDFSIDLKSVVIDEHSCAQTGNASSLCVSRVPSLSRWKMVTDSVLQQQMAEVIYGKNVPDWMVLMLCMVVEEYLRNFLQVSGHNLKY